MKVAIGCFWAGSLFVLPSAASADSSLNVQLIAHVDTFCRIYPPADSQLAVHDGLATIGQVREICNTPSGYDVAASFSNITSGNLNVGGQKYALIDGLAMRSSNQPAVRSMTWSLSDAQVTQSAEPVVMRVTITPR